MSTLTVTSGTASIIGPPAADGSFWARYVLQISDGSTVNFDCLSEPKDTDTDARLADLTATQNAIYAGGDV